MRSRLSGWGQALAATAAIVLVVAPTAAAGTRPRINPPPKVPMELPGDRATARVASAPGRWLVGGQPSATTRRIAKRFGAKSLLASTGIYQVARAQARPFAAELRAAGLLTFAEPDKALKRTAFPSDPLTPMYQWSLQAIRATPLTPPPVTPASPILGIIEDDIALGHPEFAGVHNISLTRPPRAGEHGTLVTSVAAAPAGNGGMVGVWPGMNVVVAPSTNQYCSGAVQAISDALARNVSVINMSYGFDGGCQAHRLATNAAYGRGVVLVAAAGNEFEAGNPSDQSPSADPHVMTVAAVAPDLSAAPFSTAHSAVDLAAPGVGILAADSSTNGYALVDGTSFSAPIVAAATAWVASVRPNLDQSQLTDLMRFSVRDLGPPGWDQRFGFGILDLPTALTRAAPSSDRLEPNDDVAWINGTFFKGADKPISRGKTKSFGARLDVLEDPADVYRVFVPGRHSLRITADPTVGATNLKIFNHRSKTIYSKKRLIGSARRKGGKADRVTLTNRGRKGRLVYIDVYPDTRANTLDAAYKLTVKRVSYKRTGRKVP